VHQAGSVDVLLEKKVNKEELIQEYAMTQRDIGWPACEYGYHVPLNPMPRIPVAIPDDKGTIHPGSFGIDRHQHVHTGVDLYAAYGTPVRAMEDGNIIQISWFTGPSIDMPWWNDTRAVYIEGIIGVFNYGEIQELPTLKVGDTVKAGDLLGYVVTVLRKWKGRPMSMLHVELYDHGYTDDWKEWKIGDPKPEHLKDPTPYLLTINQNKNLYQNVLDRGILGDPYKDSADQMKAVL
jgi:murein DD-endopeptidase MepM/ murein hydrolase activator NlpD